MVIVIAIALLLGACNKEKEEVQEPASETEEQTVEISELEEAEAEEVLQTYADTYQKVIENVEDDGELVDFDSVADLKEEFVTIMSEELADDIIATFFKENEEGLIYTDTSETPVWLDDKEAYQFEKVEDDLYEVEQEQADHEIIVTYSISWDEEKWIVSDVEIEEIPAEESNDSNNDSDAETDPNGQEDNAAADDSTDEEETNGDANPTTDENAINDNDAKTADEQEDNRTSADSENEASEQKQDGSSSDGNGDTTGSDASGEDQDSDLMEDDGENPEDATAPMSESKAESIVKQHLNITDGDFHVVTDHQDENGNYVIQVFEIIEQGDSSHTSTYGWFIVNKDTGNVEQMQ